MDLIETILNQPFHPEYRNSRFDVSLMLNFGGDLAKMVPSIFEEGLVWVTGSGLITPLPGSASITTSCLQWHLVGPVIFDNYFTELSNFRPAVKRTLTRKNHVFACSLFSCAYSSLKLQISTRSHYWCPQASRSSCLSEEFSNSGMFVIRCSCCFLSGNNSRNITLTAISRKPRDLYGSSAARVWANRAEYVHRHAKASWPR